MAVPQKSSRVKRSLSWPVQDLGIHKNGVTIYTTEGCTSVCRKTIFSKLQEMDNKLGHLLLEVQKMKSKHPVKKRSAVSRRKKIVRSKKSLNRGLTCDERESHMRCQQQKTLTMGKEGIRYFEEHFLEKMLASLLTDYRTKEMKRRKSTTVKEVNSVDTKIEMLLDSFMYRDYFNGRSDGRKNVALHPLIATSRNLDEFVAKELSSGTRQSTNHPSEEASRSSSNESLSSSEGPHSMNLELVRLGTFKNFPLSRSVSAFKLAKEGFYYIGQGEDDLVICFACKSEKRGWRDGDIPREIHQQMSPQCPLLNEQSVNVPVGGSLNSLNGNHQQHSNTEQVSETSDNERNNQHSNSEQVNEPSQRTIPQNLSDPQTTEIGRRSEETGTESTVEQGSGSISGSPTLDRDHLVPASNRNTERSETLSSQNNQSTESQSNPNHKKSRAIQEQINAFLRNLDPLGINFDRAKYPAYAVLATRVSSFQDWPTSLTQTPQVLALAGFFYAGYGDYTRCFFCGGGLRNWEPGDDPWTEHARWFPKCAFVRQNRGDEFVALVQIRHQELEALEAMGEESTAASSVEQSSSVEQNGGLSSGSRQTDITAFPSFQSVLEMGYPESEIREAFNQLRGTKDPEDITGMDLMEVILRKEDRTNGLDIPPPIHSPRPANESQSRNPSVDHNTPDISQGGQLKAAIGPTPQETSESGAHEKTQKNQDKDAATSNTEEKFDSLNDALAPAMSLEDTRSLMEENKKLRDLRMCKICMENDASIAMLPCGHLCCCADCAPAMRKCPICRQFVKGTVRTWLA
ncbi:baculoviral IAP repeat-containing protein 3-like isoform X2 [Crassostrea angulata]|nr:baculoviral IAP repeat-containing protein 3-like isoform X2 [Crassostrea angulata]XP_052710303.1 baculoviral IAP repeat-containing protein 3-like isoform X2 [Crassostrea angulata]